MIKVLIVEDQITCQELLTHILNSDQEIEVIGTASNGEEALAFLAKEKPQVITMDMNMPKMNGLETIKQIMSTTPLPILVVSASYKPDEVARSFDALEAGAVAVIEKPFGPGHPDHERAARELVEKVKLLVQVKVVRRSISKSPRKEKEIRDDSSAPIEVIGIGASTGGPQALEQIFSGLPADFPFPLLVVQHIARGFLDGMARWLQEKTALSIHLGRDGEKITPGKIYLAPDEFQMGLKKNGQIYLSKDGPEYHVRPSVSYLFRSLSQNYGPRALGILLSGMGRDGARELKMMRDQEALTIAQNAESCIVFGMPGEAIALGGAELVLSPEEMVEKLISLSKFYSRIIENNGRI